MPIQASDIRFVQAQVMDDVPEGGGGPTGNLVPDGADNALLSDVSELDRVQGRMNFRKVVLTVRSGDVDTLLGPNVIIDRPPEDPNISIVLFRTGELFDRRADAIARLEAYLNKGPSYAGVLYGNHLAGQRTLLLYQKTDDLPAIDSTMALTKREGYSDEVVEYVRIIEASSELREFEDSSGKFTRYIVTLKLLTPLEHDFAGFDVSRFEITQDQLALKTKPSDTVVADAARYQGVSALEEDGHIGDFTIKVVSPFAQLVPSSQVEVPIPDARTNQLADAAVGSGGTVVQTFNALFTPTQGLFIGGGFAPGSLQITDGTITLEDVGGRLMNAGTQVGTVDVENGVASLNSPVFGTAPLALTVTYDPAGTPQAVNQSMGFAITAENRSTSYVRTIEPPPVPGTLALSYRSGGRWYVLKDDGSGAMRGSSSAFGIGNLNLSTGTWAASLGALPDVGSSILLTWVQPDAARDADALTLDNDGRLYWAFNTSGASSLEPGSKSIEPGGLSISWPHESGTGTRTATDDGEGNLIGDATGTVYYARGAMRISPNVLPAPGTTFTVTLASAAKSAASLTLAGGSGSVGMTGVTPGSVSMTVTAQLKWRYLAGAWQSHGAPQAFLVTDDGAGGLRLHVNDELVPCGTFNYAAGTFALTGNLALPQPVVAAILAWDNVYMARESANLSWYTLVAG